MQWLIRGINILCFSEKLLRMGSNGRFFDFFMWSVYQNWVLKNTIKNSLFMKPWKPVGQSGRARELAYGVWLISYWLLSVQRKLTIYLHCGDVPFWIRRKLLSPKWKCGTGALSWRVQLISFDGYFHRCTKTSRFFIATEIFFFVKSPETFITRMLRGWLDSLTVFQNNLPLCLLPIIYILNTNVIHQWLSM